MTPKEQKTNKLDFIKIKKKKKNNSMLQRTPSRKLKTRIGEYIYKSNI